MTTYNDAWQAGIDAVVRDNATTRQQFADAIRTVLTSRFSDSAALEWIDAVAAEFARLNIINNGNFNRLRAHIIDGAKAHRDLFDSLATIGQLPETQRAAQSAELIGLREERDNIDGAIARVDALIAAETNGVVGRLVVEVLRQGRESLLVRKQQVREQIRQITGDPDS